MKKEEEWYKRVAPLSIFYLLYAFKFSVIKDICWSQEYSPMIPYFISYLKKIVIRLYKYSVFFFA